MQSHRSRPARVLAKNAHSGTKEFEQFMAGLQKKQKPRVQASRQTQATTPIPTAKQLSELIRAGQHAKAIDLATTALVAAGLTFAKKPDLLDLRAESFIARGEFDLASADVDSMLVLAKRARKAAFRERAQKRGERVQARGAEGKAAPNTASPDLVQENARLFDETQRLLKETEQRAAELAVINRVQEGMAAELDFQAIVDLVGDKLREVFQTGDIGIRWYDPNANLLHYLYQYEHGVRLELGSRPPIPGGAWVKIAQTRQPIVMNSRAEAAAMGVGAIPGTDSGDSCVFVPILGSDRVLGLILIEDFGRENAYGEAELRLLTTVAASMGVALENARLFDETQRLLKETEQRAAELAVINRIQEGMATELNFQAIVDLVGDKLREVLKSDDIGIRWHDPKTNLIHYLYEFEHGKRLHTDPMPPRPGGPWEQMVQTRRAVVYNTFEESNAAGAVIPGTDTSLSSISVPIVGSDRVL